VQSEYWSSEHNAQRDPGSVITIVQNAGLNSTQLARFLVNPGKNPEALQKADIVEFANYTIQTWYVRAGYSFETG